VRLMVSPKALGRMIKASGGGHRGAITLRLVHQARKGVDCPTWEGHPYEVLDGVSDSDSSEGPSLEGAPSAVRGSMSRWQTWVATLQRRQRAWEQKTQRYRAIGTQRRLSRLWGHLSRTKEASASAEARTGGRLLKRLLPSGGVAGTAAGGEGSTLALGPESLDPALVLAVGEALPLSPLSGGLGVEPLSGALGPLFGGGFL
jgi:hypothetical protein